MRIELSKKPTSELYNTPIIQQTSFWSDVKHCQGVESKAFDFKAANRELYVDVGGYSTTNADLVMFIQYLNRYDCIAYLPYGPEVEPSEENQGVFLEELSEVMRTYLPVDCIAIRYDLNWQSHWCKQGDYDTMGNWLGLPDKTYQEYQLNFDTINHNLVKTNGDILPANTVILDLSGSNSDILARMKPKTRYNIGLAHRHGIEVRTMGMRDIDLWYSLYVDTAHRNGLFVNDIGYFKSVFSARPESPDSQVSVRLLVAFYGNVPLAAMFLVISSHRATYLYGASSSENRNLMPTYALQWEAICEAKKAGCSEYDMFGIAPNADPSHPMYGLYKFKLGFGGDIFHQMGCWDYPLIDDRYALFQASQINSQGYYV